MTYNAAQILTFVIVAMGLFGIVFRIEEGFMSRHVVAPFPKHYDDHCFGCSDPGSGCRGCKFGGLRGEK